MCKGLRLSNLHTILLIYILICTLTSGGWWSRPSGSLSSASRLPSLPSAFHQGWHCFSCGSTPPSALHGGGSPAEPWLGVPHHQSCMHGSVHLLQVTCNKSKGDGGMIDERVSIQEPVCSRIQPPYVCTEWCSTST